MKSIISHHCWLEGRGHHLLQQLLPVNGGEEHVCLDILYSISTRSKPVSWVPLEKCSKESLGFWTQEAWHAQLFMIWFIVSFLSSP